MSNEVTKDEGVKKAGEHLNKFVEDFRTLIGADIEKESQSSLGQLKKEMGGIDTRFVSLEKNFDTLKDLLGSLQKVAVGNGTLKTISIPKNKGEIYYTIDGEDLTANVDENGNVSGKHISSHDIQQDKIVVSLSKALDPESEVTFSQNTETVKEQIRKIHIEIDNIQKERQGLKESFAHKQMEVSQDLKRFEEKIDKLQQGINTGIEKSVETKLQQFQNTLEQYGKKINRIDETFVGIGNVLKNEGGRK